MFRGTHVLQVSSEKSSCVFIVHDIFCGTWSYWPYNCNVAFQLRCEIHGVKDGETRATSTCHMPTSRRSSWHMTFGPSIGLKVSRRLRPRRSEMTISIYVSPQRGLHDCTMAVHQFPRASRGNPRNATNLGILVRNIPFSGIVTWSMAGRRVRSAGKRNVLDTVPVFFTPVLLTKPKKIAPCKGWNIWKESHMSLAYMNFISINSLELDSKQKLCQFLL